MICGLINQVVGIDDNMLINRYVQDGLILHLDGINNTGTGHSDTATEWTDLVTGKNKATLTGNTSGESIWSEKAFLGHGTEKVSINLNQLYENGSGTVETRVNHKSNSTSSDTVIGKYSGGQPGSGMNLEFVKNTSGKFIKMEFRFSYDGTITNYDKSGNEKLYAQEIYCYPTQDINNITSIVDYDEEMNKSEFKFMLNGDSKNSVTVKEKRIIYRSNRAFSIGIPDTSSYNIFDDVYCVRVYNRALATEEAVHNYYIDLYRFKEEI